MNKYFVFILIIFCFIPGVSLAWGDCPFGLVDDPAPGSCGRYIDTDRDNICDNSQDAPGKRALAAEPDEDKTAVIQPKTTKAGYDLISISAVLIILYLFSLILVNKKAITLLTQRKIWNTILLIAFLVSAILGVLLVVRVNYGWQLKLPFNMLFWHVEAGLAMAIISLLHIIWHWPYFKSIAKTNKKNNDQNIKKS